MLKRFTVKGFKTLHDFTLDLSPVTVLVGANNVGKTNVVRAIELLANTVRQGSLRSAIHAAGGEKNVLSVGGSGELSFVLEGTIAGSSFRYELSNRNTESLQTTNFSMVRTPDRLQASDGLVLTGSVDLGLTHVRQRNTIADALADFLANMRCADFSAERLRESSLPTPSVELGREGQNLAAVLDRLAGERPLARNKINEELRKVMPDIDSVITIPEQAGQKLVGIAEGNRVFRADTVSDGILLFIALSTVAQMSGGSTLIAMEEIERGIHPRRIRETLDQILRISRTGTQFLLTTHSPILLSEFRDDPDAVVVLERSTTNGTTARKLSDIPEGKDATGLSLGDLWFSGVLGGVPAQ